MTRTAIVRVLGASALAFLVGCDWPDKHWRSEKYVLSAIDTPGWMLLGFDPGRGGTYCLVGPTVFSVGADDRYIVVKQHPPTDRFGAFDRAVTNFFVVERTTSLRLADREKGVRGPMDAAEFERLAGTLALPKFTKTFRDLE